MVFPNSIHTHTHERARAPSLIQAAPIGCTDSVCLLFVWFCRRSNNESKEITKGDDVDKEKCNVVVWIII